MRQENDVNVTSIHAHQRLKSERIIAHDGDEGSETSEHKTTDSAAVLYSLFYIYHRTSSEKIVKSKPTRKDIRRNVTANVFNCLKLGCHFRIHHWPTLANVN